MVPEIPLLKYFFRKSDQSTQSYRLANCGGIEITVEFGGKIQYTLKEGSETTAYEESE